MALGLLLWILLAVLAGYAVNRLWSSFVGNRAFRWAMAPGVVVHEFSHAAGCLMTGAKIFRLNLFAPEGGSVSHGKPKLPVIGETIIATMPLVGCTLALWGIWMLFHEPLGLTAAGLPDLEVSSWWPLLTKLSVRKFVYGAWDLLRDAFSQVYSRRILTFEGLAFLYLLLNFSIGMALSGQDIKRAFLGLLAIALLVMLLQYLGLWGDKAAVVVDALWSLFAFAMTMLAMALAVSIPVAAACKIAGR